MLICSKAKRSSGSIEILLDTHMLLWWLTDDSRLSKTARSLVADPANMFTVSTATAWEIAIKQALGKITIDGSLEQAVREQGFTMLPVTFPHAAETLTLPSIHRDPFDRMLVAQARVESLRLLTVDSHILQYPVNVIEG
ncbi:MAG: type II toxin-antitoxin system VapC family toxin [Pseudomonadota bacterium]